MALTKHPTSGYAYDPGLRFASNGVVSLPGFSIDHAVLASPRPFDEGAELIEAHLKSLGLDISSLCGIEVRLPATLSLDEFVAFNDRYLAQLTEWDLVREGVSPLTRTNVSPTQGAPSEPVVAAFSYVSPNEADRPTYVISGIAELAIGAAYPDQVTRRAETDAAALREKAHVIVDVLETHTATLGVTWESSDLVNLYSAHDLTKDVSREVLGARGHAPSYGLVWHDAAPPVVDLELEIDLRRYGRITLVGA